MLTNSPFYTHRGRGEGGGAAGEQGHNGGEKVEGGEEGRRKQSEGNGGDPGKYFPPKHPIKGDCGECE